MHKVYTLLSFSAHPFSAFSSGKADDKPKVSVCWLLLSVQTCCSQQLAERPLGMHSVLIVSWVYICFIFRLLLDPGRQKEAQSFPRVRIFLQEDRRWSLWVTQFLSTISQTASLPITFPDYLHSLLFTAAASFSFLVFSPKHISSFLISLTSLQMLIRVIYFAWKIHLTVCHIFLLCSAHISCKEKCGFSKGQLDFYKMQ